MLTQLGLAWGLAGGLLLVGYGLFFRRTGFSFRHPAAYVFISSPSPPRCYPSGSTAIVEVPP